MIGNQQVIHLSRGTEGVFTPHYTLINVVIYQSNTMVLILQNSTYSLIKLAKIEIIPS